MTAIISRVTATGVLFLTMVAGCANEADTNSAPGGMSGEAPSAGTMENSKMEPGAMTGGTMESGAAEPGAMESDKMEPGKMDGPNP